MQDQVHVYELLPAYALHCLDAEEASRVAEHLASCAECRAELLAYQTVAGRLALGEDLPSAVQNALDYTWRCLRDAEAPGHGQYIPRRLPLDFGQ